MRRKKNDAVAPAPKNLIINWGDKIAVRKGGKKDQTPPTFPPLRRQGG